MSKVWVIFIDGAYGDSIYEIHSREEVAKARLKVLKETPDLAAYFIEEWEVV